jgi:hypothetical protein
MSITKKNKHITTQHVHTHTQHSQHNTRSHNTRNTLLNKQHMKDKVKLDINKYIKVYKLIQKFKLFYKNLSYNELFVIKNYDYNGYKYINRFLYNNNKITELFFDKYIFYKKNKYLLTKYFTKHINYKTKTFKNNAKFISFYMNDIIINSINTFDNLFIYSLEYINKLKDYDILYIADIVNTGNTGNTSDIINNNIHIGDDVIFKNFISSSIDKKISFSFMNTRDFTPLHI